MIHEFTREFRVHRRAHGLHQEELAHLLGVTPTMIHRMEKGARAQLADVEAMLGIEIVFGKSLSEIFATFSRHVEDSLMRRAAELEAVWRATNDAKSKANLALLQDIMARISVSPEGA